MGTKIRTGLGTWIGLVGAAAGVIIPLVGDLQSATDPLGIPSSVWIVCGAVLAGLVVLGRMAQAVATILSSPPAHIELAVEPMPTEPTDIALNG
jgi:hypothetical protein